MADPSLIRVLHLEDNALDAELVSEMLLASGLPCEFRRIVHLEQMQQELADYPAKRHFDLILADFNMPGFDGMTALELTRDVDPDVPFILVSGALGEELAVELLRSGATDYVLKNNMQRLPLVVKRAIDEFKSRRREKLTQLEIRKARDEAQKANSAKGRFLGRISHELRTPLNAIIGYTQLMQADPMTQEQEHCTAQILKAGEHLLGLINEVLDITRIESGVIPLKSTITPLPAIINRAVDLVRPIAREQNITISVDGGPCDLYVHVDRDRLTQVLINLLTNAVKYNRPEGHVFLECLEDKPGRIKIMVRDTGYGIPPDKIERLFTPFDRLDLEKNSTIPGTGLGLTVSKALIEAMDGEIGVISSDQSGTVFWLEFLAAEAPQGDKEETELAPAMEAIPALPADCNILILESHSDSADFLSRVFNRRGNRSVVVSTSIAEALDEIQRRPPDVVIMDVKFPDGTASDFLEKLRANKETADVPVIVTASLVNDDMKTSLNEFRPYSYLSKPIKIRALLEMIVRAHRGGSQNDDV